MNDTKYNGIWRTEKNIKIEKKEWNSWINPLLKIYNENFKFSR